VTIKRDGPSADDDVDAVDSPEPVNVSVDLPEQVHTVPDDELAGHDQR
jgi:hypothetical protein